MGQLRGSRLTPQSWDPWGCVPSKGSLGLGACIPEGRGEWQNDRMYWKYCNNQKVHSPASISQHHPLALGLLTIQNPGVRTAVTWPQPTDTTVSDLG